MKAWRWSKVFLCLLATTTYSADDSTAKVYLLDQVLLGQVYYKDDLVEQALDRIRLIDPNNPQALVAEVLLTLRQAKTNQAYQYVQRLKDQYPNSDYYKQAQLIFELFQPLVQTKLQQARILSMAGKIKEAKTQYDEIFSGNPPTPELQAEYWKLVSRIPDQKPLALQKLQQLYDFLQQHHALEDDMQADNWVNAFIRKLANLWVDAGEDDLKARNFAAAEQKFQKGANLDKTNDSAFIGLGDIALEHKDYKRAEKNYKQALVLYPTGITAVYGLVQVYKHESLTKALSYLEGVSPDQKLRAIDTLHALQANILQKDAEQLIAKNQWQAAIEKYRQAKKILPDDVWITYDLAQALAQTGAKEQGKKLFVDLAKKLKNDPAYVYAYALYLSKIQNNDAAISLLKSLPNNKRNQSIEELQKRITIDSILDHANAMHAAGDMRGAVAYLQKQKQDVRIQLTLADWALTDQHADQALMIYQRVQKQEPQNLDASLGVIESQIALKRNAQAQQELSKINQRSPLVTVNMRRRIADAYMALNETQVAASIFTQLKKEAIKAPADQDSALVFRDAAGLERKMGLPQQAQADYREAMVKSGITSVFPDSNRTYTRMMRINPGEDWLRRSIRAYAADMYLGREHRITVDEDFLQLTGTPGTSEFNSQDTIVQTDGPLLVDGRYFVRADIASVSAGNFTPINGAYTASFGTCTITPCTSGFVQRAQGIGFDAGWRNPIWAVDLGFTPIGFVVSNVVGGLNYSSAWGPVGYTLTLSRRPMVNSLLSVAGAIDPNTGIRWGGVVTNQFTFSGSYDRGGPFGIWVSWNAGVLTGQNVVTNERVRLMQGYYYKLINEDNRRAIIGLTTMFWHYQRNIYGFTLGQGGYYSPQIYASASFPIDYRKRTENWSYELGGSVSYTYASTQNSALYPIPGLIPNFNPEDNSFGGGGPSPAFGYTLLALVERRLTDHWIIGAAFDLQRTPDYTPNHGALFLRYSFEGWQGDLDFPIIPLIPYVDFK